MTDQDIIDQLKDLIEEQSQEQAPPVALDDPDADTMESLTTPMQAFEFAELADADEALPWRVNEEHGV